MSTLQNSGQVSLWQLEAAGGGGPSCHLPVPTASQHVPHTLMVGSSILHLILSPLGAELGLLIKPPVPGAAPGIQRPLVNQQINQTCSKLLE